MQASICPKVPGGAVRAGASWSVTSSLPWPLRLSAWAAQTFRTGAREFEDKELSAIRKTIASRMLQSKGPIPHFTVTVEADMGCRAGPADVAERHRPKCDKLSINHILIKGVALALKLKPGDQRPFQEGRVRLFNRVHIGVAVALEDGLIVPVISRVRTERA